MPSLRVALGEYDTGFHQPDVSLARASACVAHGAAAGARLILLPEMCSTGFTMQPEQWAEPEGGVAYARFSELAKQHEVWIIAGIATRRGDAFYNVAAVFNPAGNMAAAYAKQRLFAFGEEHEHYTAGTSPVIVDIEGVRVSPFVCYDLRFPELFREVAPNVDLMVVIASWPASRRAHWDVLLQARAIENLAYVVGVNRTGVGGPAHYDGGSAAYDPWGAPSAVTLPIGSPSVVDVSTDRVESIRKKYPFLDSIPTR